MSRSKSQEYPNFNAQMVFAAALLISFAALGSIEYAYADNVMSIVVEPTLMIVLAVIGAVWGLAVNPRARSMLDAKLMREIVCITIIPTLVPAALAFIFYMPAAIVDLGSAVLPWIIWSIVFTIIAVIQIVILMGIPAVPVVVLRYSEEHDKSWFIQCIIGIGLYVFILGLFGKLLSGDYISAYNLAFPKWWMNRMDIFTAQVTETNMLATIRDIFDGGRMTSMIIRILIAYPALYLGWGASRIARMGIMPINVIRTYIPMANAPSTNPNMFRANEYYAINAYLSAAWTAYIVLNMI